MQVYGNVARESALDTSGLQAKYLAQGFDAATAAAKAQAELNLNASKTLGDLSGRAYDQGVGGLDVMSKLGAQQQAQEQAQLDYPMSALTKSANIMKGFQVPTSQTQTYKGPMPGAYQQSGLAQLLQILSTARALSSPTGTSGTGPSAIRSVLDLIKGTGEAGTASQISLPSFYDQYAYDASLTDNPYINDFSGDTPIDPLSIAGLE
jgi:hypothetical protein